jgi:hypothetical protein
MPNHVTNIISFIGNDKDVDELLETIKGYQKTYDGILEEMPMDFNKIIPMPPELNITSGSLGSRGMQFVEGDNNALDGLREEDRREAEALGVQYVENKKKHGYTTWYNWAWDNWGTKWNAYSFEEQEGQMQFDTAWAHPLPVIEKLSTMFPNVEIECKYADEDLGYNLGSYTIKNGEILEEEEIEFGTDEATKRACEIKGYIEGEDYEIVEEGYVNWL